VINGIVYVVSGGGGTSLRATGEEDFTEFSQSVFHYLELEVDE
jgi:hypothetical protein